MQYPQPWIDAGLLSEANGERSLTPRKSHFLLSDIEKILTQLNKISVKIERTSDEMITFRDIINRIPGANYNTSEVISDIFSHKITPYTYSSSPTMQDILFSRDTFESVSALCTVRYAVKFDYFAFAAPIIRIVKKIWNDPLDISKNFFFENMRSGKIRFREKIYVYDRQHRALKFSIADELERQYRARPNTRWEFLDQKMSLIFT